MQTLEGEVVYWEALLGSGVPLGVEAGLRLQCFGHQTKLGDRAAGDRASRRCGPRGGGGSLGGSGGVGGGCRVAMCEGTHASGA